jgi:carboxypeptidase family protein/TonB-dependent receptor-like protein
MFRRFAQCVCVVAAGLWLASAAMAQTSARISGLVTDETGAVLPGVQITVKNVATGISRSLATNDRGRYVVPDLQPGPYEVTATMSGFETLVRSGITLAVGDDAPINMMMKVGAVTTAVTVTGEAPLVNTTSSGVSGVVEEKRITELPLNGRDFGQLALVQPGALDVRTAAAGDSSKGFGTRLSLSGSRPMDTGYSLDGTNVNSVGNFATPGSAAGVVLGVDAIREFRVITGGGYSAEYGGYSGGMVQMVTKSGTNQFHGTGFILHRSDKFDANTWESNKGNLKKGEFRRTQFGGSFGGPVRKDKAFFFGAYEGLRQPKNVTDITDTLDENSHKGILPNGTTVQIAPSIKPYLDLWPLPSGGVSRGNGSAQRFTPEDTSVTENYLVARVDYHLSESQTLFSRFNLDNSQSGSPGALGTFNDVVPSRNRFSTIQYENILTPRLLSSASFSFNRVSLNHDIQYLIDYPSSLFFLGKPFAPTLGLNTPGVSFSGGSQPSTRIQNKWEMSESVSYSVGNQTLKFGGSFSHIGFNNSGPAAGAFGQFTWDSLQAFLTDQNLVGLVSEVAGADTARTVRQNIYGFYFQDDWRIRSNLTWNLGLRYEPWTSPTEKWGRVSTFRDWATATKFSTPKTDGTDVYFQSPGKKSFSPRVGVAWDVHGDGKTAVRAGAGIFHVELLSPYLNTVTRKNPPDAGTLTENATAPASLATNFAGATAYVTSKTPGILSTTLSTSNVPEAFQFKLDPMYELKFNVSVERQVTNDLSVSLAYIGSRGNHLTMKSDANARPATLIDGRPFVSASTPRPNPNVGAITFTTSDAKAFYNALSVEVKKRLSAGFQLQAVYTWSKNVDDSTTGLGNSDFAEGLVTQPYNHKADRGLASTNLGQNFVVNGLWSLPSPFHSGLASAVLGGWQVSSILKASSGTPFGPTLRGSGGSGSAPDGRRSANEQHPETVAGRTVESMTSGTTAGCPGLAVGQKLGTPDLYFDPCAFSRPVAGFYGSAGRNIIIGPRFINADFSLNKSFPIHLNEGSRVQFNADFFNIANHPKFGRPQNTAIQNSNGQVFAGAGQITSTIPGSEREIQFGLKLIF